MRHVDTSAPDTAVCILRLVCLHAAGASGVAVCLLTTWCNYIWLTDLLFVFLR